MGKLGALAEKNIWFCVGSSRATRKKVQVFLFLKDDTGGNFSPGQEDEPKLTFKIHYHIVAGKSLLK